MRMAICNDEAELRMVLAEKLKKWFPSWELSAYSFETALLAAPPPDMQSPGQSGMETVRELMILIFVTTLEKYVSGI